MCDIPTVDHLLLLVGGNPLPNTVAGVLLGNKEGQLSLIHSSETAPIAQRLQSWFRDQGFALPRLYQADEAEADKITREVQRALQLGRTSSVGLNYTGGTKTMAVHAYRAAELWAGANNTPRPTFSYLDARTLRMVFDAPAPENGEASSAAYAGQAAKITVKDLVALHGWTLLHEPVTVAILPQTAGVLAMLNANNDSHQAWLQWIRAELLPKCRRPDDKDWKSKTELKQQHLAWPDEISPLLQEITAVLQQELGLNGKTLSVHEAAVACGYREPKHFCGWLHGKWLEHYTLDILNNAAETLHLHQSAQNIEPREVQFDVDVVAMRGYQLFAISCSTDDTKPLLKSKLFEAYIRARQIGGDEARVALICGIEKPEVLEREMRRDVDPDGRIRVFGREQFPTLAEELAWWIKDQSQEP